jgi:hypothetical protein
MRRYILDKTEPVPCENLMDWAKWMETADRIVDESFMEHPATGVVIRVSTVFLGLDYRFGPGGGPPVLFETMAFGQSEDISLFGTTTRIPRALPYQPRYCTWDEALAGHKKVHEDIEQSVRLEVSHLAHQLP